MNQLAAINHCPWHARILRLEVIRPNGPDGVSKLFQIGFGWHVAKLKDVSEMAK